MTNKRFKEKEKGTFIGHTACPKCGSSDAGSVYRHDDGSHSMTCFACEKGFPEWDVEKNQMSERTYEKTENTKRTFEGYDMAAVKEDLVAMDLPDRVLPEALLESFGVKVDTDGNGDICAHFYPTYKLDNAGVPYHAGYRVRHRFPDDYKKPELRGKLKDFSGGVGDISGELQLFGSQRHAKGGKRLFIWEGEIESMTADLLTSMIVEKNRRKHYAHTSLPSGANIKGIKDNYQYITSFEEIYICADNDEAGAKFMREAARILPIEKVRIFQYPENIKDLSDWWKGSQKKRKVMLDEFKHRLYNAERYCPAGIKNFADGFDAMKNRGKVPLIPFPESFGDLNALTFGGYGKGEITTIAAPSSVGKSAFTREMIYTAFTQTDEKIGVIPCEDTYEELMEMLCSVHLSKQISEIPYDERNWDEIKEAHKQLSEGRRINIVDHQGAIDQDNLLEFIDYLVGAMGCGVIILDPVTLALSKAETDEEEVLSEILRRCKRLGYAHVNVCHVRKNSGGQKANSEGGDVAEEDIKGSGAYFQISMNNLILTRNKVDSDRVRKNITKIKLTKCRRHGKSTGIAGYAYYDGETGRLVRAAGAGEELDTAMENIKMQYGIEDEEDVSSSDASQLGFDAPDDDDIPFRTE